MGDLDQKLIKLSRVDLGKMPRSIPPPRLRRGGGGGAILII